MRRLRQETAKNVHVNVCSCKKHFFFSSRYVLLVDNAQPEYFSGLSLTQEIVNLNLHCGGMDVHDMCTVYRKRSDFVSLEQKLNPQTR